MMLAAAQESVQPMRLPELLQSDAAELEGVVVSGMQLDSRKVMPGDVFLAMPGEQHDGRQFIEQAVANGAAAVLAEAPVAGFVDAVHVPLVEIPELRAEAGFLASRFYRDPSQSMHVVGITGTNGKTTTSRLFAQLARACDLRCGVIGTLGASLNDEVSESTNTTPDAIALQQQLAHWHGQGVPAVGMEVSSHALVQGRVNGVTFETAVYTNLSHDHLDYHGSMANYARAKMRLFAMQGLRNAIINVDDDMAALIAAGVSEGVQILTYSASGAGADIRVVDAMFHAGGVRARLQTPWGEGAFDSPFPGRFNLANLAAAVAALVLAGQDLTAVLAAVPRLQPISGRMQSIPNDLGIQVVVDYAHTPDALAQALQALRPHVAGRLITVFGCGGDRDREKRQLMGRVATTHSDCVIITSDNPRSEDPQAILRDVAAGCVGDFATEVDRATAIALAIEQAAAGDCVLVAGKGHEPYQLVDGVRMHFSDVEQASAALARRRSL
ncbi:MAG: UDP-N-acetylmuramoyl-L-alanyl-D-glutamate--2,6-diaminopimelate ligase [Gammaproteobacteria bacterium]|nr:UDP-N-acetylmuramoyl-L-alanyl-D-glutamate--2,6-diaminopimelate ligase [Gammaproteobacteria bacterium]